MEGPPTPHAAGPPPELFRRRPGTECRHASQQGLQRVESVVSLSRQPHVAEYGALNDGFPEHRGLCLSTRVMTGNAAWRCLAVCWVR